MIWRKQRLCREEIKYDKEKCCKYFRAKNEDIVITK